MKTSLLNIWVMSGLTAASAVGAAVWLAKHPGVTTVPQSPALVYTSKGFGGYQLAKPDDASKSKIVPEATEDPAAPALKAYQQSDFLKAETLAEAVVRQYQGTNKPKEKKYAALAQWVDAYSAACRKDFTTARERFGYLRDMAAQLPDKGKWPSMPGEVTPTLEEEGAFQQAVCTSATDGPKAAQSEYERFLRAYPQSVLIHGAIKKIARLHGGDIPKADEALWKQDMKLQQAQERVEARQSSQCGPDCLAELLRRQGKSITSVTLAKEMGTSEHGTSLQAMIDAGAKHGLKFKGVALSMQGLQQQKLPLITLVQPGHFVVVEAVKADGITVWDPNAKGLSKGGMKAYTPAMWNTIWRSDALITP